MSIADNIKKLREMHDMSQKEFGELFDSSDSTVSSWETGVRVPTMGIIQRMADHFGIRKSNIIEDDGLKIGFHETSNGYNPEMDIILQAIKDRPEMHTLFSTSVKASKDQVLKTIKMLEIFKDENHDL